MSVNTTRPTANHDSVAITGSVIGIASMLLGWLTLKPNRLAAGASLNLWESLGNVATLIIAVLWLACLILSLRQRDSGTSAILGILANIIVIITFAAAGLSADRLLATQPPFARVSPGAGVWTTGVAAFIVIFASRRRLAQMPLLQFVISLAGLAGCAVLLVTGWLDEVSVVQEFHASEGRFMQELGEHVLLFGSSVVVGTLIGVPLGIWAERSRRAERPIFIIANITQTIPSLALFGLLIAPLSALSFAFPVLREFGIRGVGAAPALIALTLYALLPVVQNTYIGLRQIDPGVIDAGQGMGMSRRQRFLRLEAPLAAPLVLEGVRTASVQAVGNAAVAALIGAGGLGLLIFQGLGQAASDLIILGALPIIGLALIVDAVMRAVVRIATPRGITG